MRINTVLLCISLLFITACASGFEENYHPVPHQNMPTTSYQLCPSPKVEKLTSVADMDAVQEKMLHRGYVLIGRAQWESTIDENDYTAMEQGQKVGACLVLWRRMNAGVERGYHSVGTYEPGHDERVTVHDGKYTKTEYVHVPGRTVYHDEPYAYQRYDYVGLFFAKQQGHTDALGIDSAAPSTAFMAKHDSRRGIRVVSVHHTSPAYAANIFEGDVIVEVNGKDVFFGQPLPLIAGQENSLLIIRNGQKLHKNITPYAHSVMQ